MLPRAATMMDELTVRLRRIGVSREDRVLCISKFLEALIAFAYETDDTRAGRTVQLDKRINWIPNTPDFLEKRANGEETSGD